MTMTPKQAWNGDRGAIRSATDGLHWMLGRRVTRTLNKDGVHVDNVVFVAPEFNGLIGEKVEVRYKADDLREIVVYRDDDFLAVAHPQQSLSAEDREALIRRREAENKRKATIRRRATANKGRELASARAALYPVTSPVAGNTRRRAALTGNGTSPGGLIDLRKYEDDSKETQ